MTFDIENLLQLSDEALRAKLLDPKTPRLEWVAVAAVVEQRNREKGVNETFGLALLGA